MPDRCFKLEESKHSAPIFCRGRMLQSGGVFVRSREGSTRFYLLSFSLRKFVGLFLESLGTCMLIGDLLVFHVFDTRSREHSTCQIGALKLKNLNIRSRRI
jgi:hypothetical protein